MEKKYKDYIIRFSENTEKFEAIDKKEGVIYTHSSYKQVEQYIDKLLKKGFKRIPVIYDDYGKYRQGEVTSAIPEEKDVWIVNNEGERCKKHITYSPVYKDNEKNWKILSAIEQKNKEIEKLQKEIGELEKQFEQVTYKELGIPE